MGRCRAIALTVALLITAVVVPASAQLSDNPRPVQRTVTIPGIGLATVEVGFSRGTEQNARPYGFFDPERDLTFPFHVSAAVQRSQTTDAPVVRINWRYISPSGRISDTHGSGSWTAGFDTYRYSRGPFREHEMQERGGHQFEFFMNGVVAGRLFLDIVPPR